METDCAPDILCMIGEEYLKLGILEGEPSAISIFERALQKKKNSKVSSKSCMSLTKKHLQLDHNGLKVAGFS